ncbi:MAG: ABC transporter permease [Saprospiraceae bacterium]
MFKYYFTIAWRSILKNKASAFINLTGLTTGLTCCLLMVLYLQHELSYDQFQKKGDRIARVIMSYGFNGSPLTNGNFTSTKVLPSFKKNFPEVVDGVRLSDLGRLVKYKDITFDERGFLYADSSFFKIFDFKLLSGSPDQVLNAVNQIVLTQSAAKKYFGEEDPIGKTLQISSSQVNYTVTGIVADCPSNSQIQFDMVASFLSLGTPQEESYFEANFTTYLLLRDKNAISSLQEKIEPFMKYELKDEKGVYINYLLEPFTRVHLYSAYDAMTANSNIKYIYMIVAIAILVLLIACFTYINLSTARSIERAKEVGIRKVSGAVRGQVFWQFITESVLISFIAFIFSIGLLILVLPSFNQLSNKHLLIAQLWDPSVVGASLFIIVIIALLAGSYPALILSKFEPIKVLKGAFKNTSSGVVLRQSLTVFQFMISLFLIASTIIISKQLHFIQTKKMGYDREHILVMKIDQKIRDKIDLIKSELKTNSNVLAVTRGNFTPVNIPGGYSMYRGDQSADQSINTRGNNIDEEYLKTNRLELIAGSDLSHQDLLDATHDNDGKKNYFHFIINESAVKKLGWSPQDAIGKKMFLGDGRPGEIKGVVKDFHFASLHITIEPLVLFPTNFATLLMIKISGNDISRTISFIQNKWTSLAPHRPPEYHFMDEDFNKLYDAEFRISRVFNIFSMISILLACLGLFGLSSYSTKQRIKELGIRKVLGASVINIILLLSSHFLKLVLISCLLIIPVVWFTMDKWLQDFAYRIKIEWWMFLLTAAIAIAIAAITVSLQAIKAAIANPINALRSD